MVKRILVDSSTVEAVSQWKQPTNATKVISFQGLARRFVEEISKISSLLTALTCKNAKFEWKDTYEKSFQGLKK